MPQDHRLTGVTAWAASPSSRMPGPSRREHFTRLPAHKWPVGVCMERRGQEQQNRTQSEGQGHSYQQGQATVCADGHTKECVQGFLLLLDIAALCGPAAWVLCRCTASLCCLPAGLGASLSTWSAIAGIQSEGTPVNFSFNTVSICSLVVSVACSPVLRLMVPLQKYSNRAGRVNP